MGRMFMERKLSIFLAFLMVFSLFLQSGVLANSKVSTNEELLHMKFDFGPEGSLVAEGYMEVTDKMIYDEDRGYGFVDEADSRDQGAPDDLRRDFILAHEKEFMVDVPNGDYEVIIVTGSNNDGN